MMRESQQALEYGMYHAGGQMLLATSVFDGCVVQQVKE